VHDAAVDGFLAVLEGAVRRRVQFARESTVHSELPSVAVLFSGGVDCAVLAAVLNRVLPPNVPVDLVNVAFDNARVRNAASKASVGAGGGAGGAGAGKRPNGKRQSKAKQRGGADTQVAAAAAATAAGTSAAPSESDKSAPSDSHANHVDLPATDASALSGPNNPYRVPDRVTGEATLAELRALKPAREWRFVAVRRTHSALLSRSSRHCVRHATIGACLQSMGVPPHRLTSATTIRSRFTTSIAHP
jgi:hypothetical protein